ncbi:MAG: fatty acid desaturase [Halomonas sp.]|nr:fatty acid desaturase [Halomonas sp.]MDM7481608.1 fatty acid desaturase [Halomonas sp.]
MSAKESPTRGGLFDASAGKALSGLSSKQLVGRHARYRCANMPSRRKEFVYDNAINSLFLLAWATMLVLGALYTKQSVILLLGLGLLLPFFLWSTIMGFVVYVQHTHPSVKWYEDKNEWSADRAHLTATVHLQGPAWLDGVLHNILAHTAHHVDMAIMHEDLPQAQHLLETVFPSNVPSWRWSWKTYFANARRCGVYDYKNHRWLAIPEIMRVELP